MSLPLWIYRREQGHSPYLGETDNIMARLYKGIEPFRTWAEYPKDQDGQSEFGAIFNLEFSIEGNVLAAACERKSILIFDTVTYKIAHTIDKAHTDNVNCIKFLDNHSFATCSDDTTVALWDMRSLKDRVKTLRGHSNWVKNVEYSAKEHMLVSSGFDGSIFLWDVASSTENGLVYQKAFNTPGLMRCRLSPDGSKLVMSTTGGYMMIIHNLDLPNLSSDLRGFRPSIYRLMQMGDQYIPSAAHYDYLFSKRQKKNRVELVTDFPESNDAEIILALQMHPSGQSVLSRNISYDEITEWSCIHDINEEHYDLTDPDADTKFLNRKETQTSECEGSARTKGERSRRIRRRVPTLPSTSAGLRTLRTFRHPIRMAARRNASTHRNTIIPMEREVQQPEDRANPMIAQINGAHPTPDRNNYIPDIWAAEITYQERANRNARGGPPNSIAGYDVVYAVSSGLITNPSVANPGSEANSAAVGRRRAKKPILQNARKLMYYIPEMNTGKGYIKEPNFSADGRIICSPCNTGVRLLSYTKDCSLLPQFGAKDELKTAPVKLEVIKTINCHSQIVLSTAFSPRQPMLVTGCRGGKLVWHLSQL